jgi:2-C-methyl-D-erythritol 4-phosphate cytidylyltransferase
MNKYAVIVAGGSGQRMGVTLPKQFLLLRDKPLLCYSIEAFLDSFDDISIVLVLPKDHIHRGEEIIHQHRYKNVKIIAGGETRFNSVKNGLMEVSESSIIFVHDAVRCMVSKDLIHRCYTQALEKGSAVPAVAATDTIRIEEGSSHHIIDRNNVRIIQTPQTFKSDILLPAFNQDNKPHFTDEASVVEDFGTEVYLINGEESNIKITRPIDLIIAEAFFNKMLFKEV